ncbi:MAG TPA: Uma2 family endonuclease [Isosphaeraceae bacterium]|nr:Uma2 family endonuclease [Isosphaeraceae bacterium]
MATITPTLTEIEYPSSDGEPMAETPVHRDVMIDLIVILKAFYAADPDVYVSGNMMMYYVEGNADKSVSPDVFVTIGIPKLPEREIYQIWREGKAPDLVIEVTSSSTARVDQRRKFALYRDVLKVREYVMFDPREKTLAGASLCVYRLIDDQYELIPMVDGRVASEVLGLHLEASGEHLLLFDPEQGCYLPTPDEIREALERETAARFAAEEISERETAARFAAEETSKRETAARLAAEEISKRETAARLAAESEVERLRREIEALRRAAPSGS